MLDDFFVDLETVNASGRIASTPTKSSGTWRSGECTARVNVATANGDSPR